MADAAEVPTIWLRETPFQQMPDNIQQIICDAYDIYSDGTPFPPASQPQDRQRAAQDTIERMFSNGDSEGRMTMPDTPQSPSPEDQGTAPVPGAAVPAPFMGLRATPRSPPPPNPPLDEDYEPTTPRAEDDAEPELSFEDLIRFLEHQRAVKTDAAVQCGGGEAEPQTSDPSEVQPGPHTSVASEVSEQPGPELQEDLPRPGPSTSTAEEVIQVVKAEPMWPAIVPEVPPSSGRKRLSRLIEEMETSTEDSEDYDTEDTENQPEHPPPNLITGPQLAAMHFLEFREYASRYPEDKNRLTLQRTRAKRNLQAKERQARMEARYASMEQQLQGSRRDVLMLRQRVAAMSTQVRAIVARKDQMLQQKDGIIERLMWRLQMARHQGFQG